jgi:hypothetical protein
MPRPFIGTSARSSHGIELVSEASPLHTVAVIPREGGVSSTPRLIDSIIAVSGILDHPPARVMTVEYDVTISRRIAPEVCLIIPALFDQRAQGRPGACCTRGLACQCTRQKRTRAYRAAGAFRPSLRNGFTVYFVLFPENGSFASVVSGAFPANLAPAPRRPNHTTSPYASGAYVYRALSVHRISPRVRDVREAPLICRETGEVVRLIWVRTKAEYF